MADTENKQAIRSKKKIVESLLHLMKNNAYEVITIQEICYEANIARKTYYNNFSSKEEVLLFYLRRRSENYLSHIEHLGNMTVENLTLTYIDFTYRNLDFMKLLVKNNIFHTVLKEYDRFLFQLFDSYWKDRKKDFSHDESAFEYSTLFYAGGLWHMLERWIQNSCPQSPEELSRIYLKILRNRH